MSTRERIGLVLFAAGAAVAPFGYWVHFRWYIAAMVLASPGLVPMLTQRLARRASQVPKGESANVADVPPGPHELRGFRGGGVLDGHADIGATDVHD
ncbi:MAG: hypothetical protein H0T80_08275 [Betaproteobacteria bacterium]|nr:hypothetical protein [Betaproteobacteria bacterium]